MRFEKLHIIYIYILGFTFISSGLSKLFPVSAFEFQIVSSQIITWDYAPILARLILIGELTTGFHLILFPKTRKYFLIIALCALSGFSIYLSFVLVKFGNQANCACFGQILPMSTIAALIKNIILLTPGLFLLKRFEGSSSGINYWQLASFTSIVILLLVLFPVKKYDIPAVTTSIYGGGNTIAGEVARAPVKALSNPEKKIIERDSVQSPAWEHLPQAHSVFTKFNNFSNGITNLDAGLKLVTVFSLDCEHCLKAATELSKLSKSMHVPGIYALLFGDEVQLKLFVEQSKISFSYIQLPPEQFFPLLTKNPPRIVLLGKGNILFDAEGEEFHIDSLKQKLRLYK